jgi:hypothetical protein
MTCSLLNASSALKVSQMAIIRFGYSRSINNYQKLCLLVSDVSKLMPDA